MRAKYLRCLIITVYVIVNSYCINRVNWPSFKKKKHTRGESIYPPILEEKSIPKTVCRDIAETF